MCSSDLFKDVHGSDIIFGGPHAIFSEAFSRLGKNVNHIQTLLTEIASSYRRSPATFVRADLGDHGPEDSKREWKDKCCLLDPETGEGSPPVESMLCENACSESLVPLLELEGLQDNADLPKNNNFNKHDCPAPSPPEDDKPGIPLSELMDHTPSDKLPQCLKLVSLRPLHDTHLTCLADASAEAAEIGRAHV